MTKRYTTPTGRTLIYAVMTCPFCHKRTVENPNMPWCSNAKCLVEYREARQDPRTGAQRFVFDDQRKTPRYALAKAFMAAVRNLKDGSITCWRLDLQDKRINKHD